MIKKNLIKIVSLLGSIGVFASPALAFAQSQFVISSSVPGQYVGVTGTAGPGAFISNFYHFSLFIAGILAFGVIVYGGIKYMLSAGNPSGASEAKEWIEAALLGLLLLAGAYFVLAVINPQLLNLNLPLLSGLPVNVTGVYAPSGGGTGSTGGSCKAPTTGPCVAANLQNTCLGNNAPTFAGICGQESGGNASIKSGTDYCLGPSGQKLAASVGLFQINLTNSWKYPVDGKNCASAFTGQAVSCSGKSPCTTGHNGTGQQCQVSNMTLYNDCVAAAQNAAANISDACQLTGSNGLGPWKGDAKACGF